VSSSSRIARWKTKRPRLPPSCRSSTPPPLLLLLLLLLSPLPLAVAEASPIQETMDRVAPNESGWLAIDVIDVVGTPAPAGVFVVP
jgi:hypothetical protein